MSIMRAFEKGVSGFLSGEIDKSTARRLKQEKIDDRNAAQADQIALMEKEAEINAQIEADKNKSLKEQNKKDITNLMLGMGFTEDYINKHGQSALFSENAFNSWYNQRASYFGSDSWHLQSVHPNAQGAKPGMLVWEYEMLNPNINQLVTPDTSSFNAETVTSNLENNNNLTSNVAKSQIETGNIETGNKDPFAITGAANMFNTNTKGPLRGTELIYGRRNENQIGDSKQHASLDGSITVTAYQMLSQSRDDNGKITKNSKGDYYVPTTVGPVLVSEYFQSKGIDAYTFEGQPAFNDLQKSLMSGGIENIYPVTYKVYDPTKKISHIISGVGTSYLDKSKQDTVKIDNMHKDLETILGYNLSEYVNFNAGNPGFTQSDVQYQAYSVPFPELRDSLEGIGYNTAQIYNGKGTSSSKSASSATDVDSMLGIQPPIDIKTSERAQAISTLTSVSNYLTNDDIRTRDIGDDVVYEIPALESNSIQGALFASFNELLGSYSQNNLSEGLLKELYGEEYSLNMTPDLNDLVSRFALYHNDLYNRSIAYHTGELTGMSDDAYKDKYDSKKTDTNIFEQAKVLTSNDFKELRTSSDTINQSNIYKTNIERAAEAESNQVQENIGSIFRVNTQGGFDTAKSIIDETVASFVNNPNDESQIEDLVADLIDQLGADRDNVGQDVDYVMNNYVIPQLFPSILGQSTSDLTKGEVKAAEESVATTKWLEKDSVEAMPTIPAEAAEWRKTYASDKSIKNSGGGQGSLFDEDTGYQLFKNPELPAGEVDPRPGGDSPTANTGFGNNTTKNWDLLYGNTHNADGTPKEQ